MPAGDFLSFWWQARIDPSTGNKAGEDFEAQARPAFENLRTCLSSSGASLDDVVKVITGLGDADERA